MRKKIIHKEKDGFHYSECGVYLRMFGNTFTSNEWKDVTCKNCLRTRKKKK